MRNTAMFWVAATTMVLISVTFMAAMNFPFNWIFYITVVGQIMLVNMIFKVLKDNYTTDKTFKDFYGDHPIKHDISQKPILPDLFYC